MKQRRFHDAILTAWYLAKSSEQRQHVGELDERSMLIINERITLHVS